VRTSSSPPAPSTPRSHQPPQLIMAAETQPSPAGSVPSAPRQCWECLRRRLVCDCKQPVCNKCRTAGIVCPGYEDKKPLTWLAPGRVTSRTRKPRSPSRRGSTAKRSPKREPVAVKKRGDEPGPPPQDAAQEAAEALLSIVPRVRLRNDTCDIVEAAHYCKRPPPSPGVFPPVPSAAT
jgi:hypothetical protein